MPSVASHAEPAACFRPGDGSTVPTLEESRRFCRRLARSHYENFSVASRLLPRALRNHFHAIYAFCRCADDLADETHGRSESLSLLDGWEAELERCYAGQARHPVFVALAGTIAEFQIPTEPFRDLLSAFRQDQRVTRYETFDELLAYCRRSANPVGRLVLYLGRAHDETRAALSDSICTGLQLANFCQDVAEDWQRGRVYLPRADCHRFGYHDSCFERREWNEAFSRLLAFQVDRAERMLREGLPLTRQAGRQLGAQVWLFIHGGLKVLERIRRVDYDVWNRRPVVSKLDQVGLLAGYAWHRLTGRRLPGRHRGASR